MALGTPPEIIRSAVAECVVEACVLDLDLVCTALRHLLLTRAIVLVT